MIHTSTKWKAIRIVFGINFLGILFLGLTISSDILGFGLPGFRLVKFRTQTVPRTNYMSGYDLLPPVTMRNVTYDTESAGGQENRTCERVTNVAFLKVHKAGSTTMQNLLFRFGLRHHLNILLPKKGNYLLQKRLAIPIKPPRTYNIFACHTRYSKSLFDQLIPTGSVKIGIVREPVDRLISAAYYYRDVWHVPYLKKIPQVNFIHNLINIQEKYDKSFFSRTHNAMGYDFGFPNNINYTDKDRIDTHLNRLNSEFLLVLVVEKFEESLVMMKRYLSWSFLDIIYLKINSHAYKPIVLNDLEQAKVRETNFLDFAIYEYFIKVFEKKLKLMSDDFSKELDYFRHLLNEVYAFCSQKELQDDSKLLVNQSAWDEEFTILGEECKWMKTNELTFINAIRPKALALG